MKYQACEQAWKGSWLLGYRFLWNECWFDLELRNSVQGFTPACTSEGPKKEFRQPTKRRNKKLRLTLQHSMWKEHQHLYISAILYMGMMNVHRTVPWWPARCWHNTNTSVERERSYMDSQHQNSKCCHSSFRFDTLTYVMGVFDNNWMNALSFRHCERSKQKKRRLYVL